MPPNWRFKTLASTFTESGQFLFLKSVTIPFNRLLYEFLFFNTETTSKINLTAETGIVEAHLSRITGVVYGVFILDEPATNNFEVSIPNSAIGHKREVTQFMNEITPIGRKFTIIYY